LLLLCWCFLASPPTLTLCTCIFVSISA
jgi:hypothetical protein